MKLIVARQFGFHGTEKQLMDPATNICYASQYLKYQINRYHNVPRALTAYNRGNSKNLTTSKYADKVIQTWKQRRLTLTGMIARNK